MSKLRKITSTFISSLIILLSSIAVGMMIGLIIKKDISYHGPNALSHIKRIYMSKKNGKCYQMAIKLMTCPAPEPSISSWLRSFIDRWFGL